MVTFFSKYSNLTVVVKNSRKLLSKDGEVVVVAGKKAEFHNGYFQTDDIDIIDFLKQNKDYGVMFNCVTKEGTPEVKTETVQSKSKARREQERQDATLTEAEHTDKKIVLE